MVAGGRLGFLLVHPYRGWPYSRAGEAGFFSRLDVAAKRAAETSIFSLLQIPTNAYCLVQCRFALSF